MLLGTEVSAGWAGKAVARVSAQLGRAGFDDAMTAALAAECVLAADETPVTTSANAGPKPRSAIRPCPVTGIPSPPSPAGAGSAATSTPPRPGRAAASLLLRYWIKVDADGQRG